MSAASVRPSRRERRRLQRGGGERAWLSPRAGLIVLYTTLAAAGAIAYADALNQPFMFDDMGAIVDNRSIRQLTDAAVLHPERETPVAGRPLVNLSFAVNYAIGGLNVFGYRLWNLALHVLCGLLLFAIVREALALPGSPAVLSARRNAVGFVVALLWMVHPLNSEVVLYVTQRTESMMALFYLLTLYASLRAR